MTNAGTIDSLPASIAGIRTARAGAVRASTEPNDPISPIAGPRVETALVAPHTDPMTDVPRTGHQHRGRSADHQVRDLETGQATHRPLVERLSSVLHDDHGPRVELLAHLAQGMHEQELGPKGPEIHHRRNPSMEPMAAMTSNIPPASSLHAAQSPIAKPVVLLIEVAVKSASPTDMSSTSTMIRAVADKTMNR